MRGQTNEKIIAEERQRKLRNNPTDAELRLWQRLRYRQIENCKFRRQHPFGNFILDFVCLERKIIIELDGSQHRQESAYDNKRSLLIEQAGFVVLRFWNNEVFENIEGVLKVILQTLRSRAATTTPTPSPPPTPPLEGEGRRLPHSSRLQGEGQERWMEGERIERHA